MLRKSLVLGWVFLAACSRSTSHSLGRHLPFPTKDEVALVDGRPFTITDFLKIQNHLKNPTPELAYWIGVSTLVLEKEGEIRGKILPLPLAYDIARYAAGELQESENQGSFHQAMQNFFGSSTNPQDIKKEIDRITQKAVVQKNPQPLNQYL